MKTIIILGPTASGKTQVAFELSKILNGEIISADSIQVYKFLDIGSAKPSKEMLDEIQHHLINIKYPNEEFNAVDFAKAAKETINTIRQKGKTPILSGGTLFYIDALLSGLDLIPEVDIKIKSFFNDISDEKIADLYSWVQIIDPKWSHKIHRNDSQRINRALSVYLQNGKTLTSYFLDKNKLSFFDDSIIFYLQSSDEKLKEHIILRTLSMVDGLIEETKKLLEMGYAQAKSLQSIGYRQACQYLSNKLTKDELIESIIHETLLYAKRQKTYFNSKFKNKAILVNSNQAFDQIMEYLTYRHFF